MKRDAYIDNIKGYLIILVVFGHIIERMKGNFDIGQQLYTFIYIFHMPAFTFLSGYLSTKEKGSYTATKSFVRILFPYIIFQLLFLVIMYLYNPLPSQPTRKLIYQALVPQYALWYIFCLFFWRLILPYFVKLPYPVMLSIVIGLLGGFLPKHGLLLSSSRLLAFFPFFVVGYYARTEKWFPYQPENRHGTMYVTASTAILLCALTCSVILNGRFTGHFLYYRFYFETGQSVWLGLLGRAIAYSMATLAGLSFMLIIPKGRSLISLIGERSLYVYLLHSLILYVFVQSQLLSVIRNLYSFAGITLSGLFLAVLLSTDTIHRLARPIVEPHTWILRSRKGLEESRMSSAKAKSLLGK